MTKMIESKDVNQSAEELMETLAQLKQVFKQEVEEKEKLKQKLDFIENNSEWSKRYVNHLRQQITEFKTCIECQQNSLNVFNQIKETNKDLNEKICSLNAIIQKNEDSNQEMVDKIKSEMNSEIEELNQRLSLKEKEIQDLKLTINSKDILQNQLKSELNDNKQKNEENLNEIKEFYENKIKNIYKEFDDNYQKIQRQNDEKIIEIRANCMRSVDKTKDEFETKLCKMEIENKELQEKNSHLRLEFEAMKMSNKFDNSKAFSKNKTSASKSKSSVQRNSDTKHSLMIQVLGQSDEELDDPFQTKTSNNSVSKRKKLIKSNDSYLDYIRDDD